MTSDNKCCVCGKQAIKSKTKLLCDFPRQNLLPYHCQNKWCYGWKLLVLLDSPSSVFIAIFGGQVDEARSDLSLSKQSYDSDKKGRPWDKRWLRNGLDPLALRG
jgi:hypothetical protein